MKSILLSIKPKWVAKILNGEKTIEVRKKFPKDYVGWVYLYCSKSKPYLTRETAAFIYGYDNEPLNGKVVARFWCDKVDKWEIWQEDLEEKVKLACLSIKEFDNYSKGQVAFAIHISKLEIFDKPRELIEFKRYGFYENCIKSQSGDYYSTKECADYYAITKAPQNYCYVEGE